MAASIDLIARRTCMSAVLYYGLDIPTLSDAEFDDGCKRLIKEWASLSPLRRWQLGSKEDLATTGYHIKVTQACVAGACAWAGLEYPVVPTGPWRVNKKHGVLWLPAGQFSVES